MGQDILHAAESRNQPLGHPLVRSISAVLLLLVAYIHFGLFLRMMTFNHLLSTLFLLDAIGAVVAAVMIFFLSGRWVWWALGIFVAGGAAVVKTAMYLIPGFSALLLGGGHAFPADGHFKPHHVAFAGTHAFSRHAGLGHFAVHSPIPSIPAAGPVSIAIEVVFVIFAVWMLVNNHRRHTA